MLQYIIYDAFTKNTSKGGSIFMNRFWRNIESFIKGFSSGFQEQYNDAIILVSQLVIQWIFLTITFTYLIVLKLLNIYSIWLYFPVATIWLSLPIFFFFTPIENKLLKLTAPFVIKIVFNIGKNGDVISKKDWRKIKRNDPRLYQDMWKSKKYFGHCYYFSRRIAMHIENSEIMYLAIWEGEMYISHAVVVKNNCVFDTNARIHFNLQEYITLNQAKVYKTFTRNEFEKDDFFSDIRQGLVQYCADHNIYCDPE